MAMGNGRLQNSLGNSPPGALGHVHRGNRFRDSSGSPFRGKVELQARLNTSQSRLTASQFVGALCTSPEVQGITWTTDTTQDGPTNRPLPPCLLWSHHLEGTEDYPCLVRQDGGTDRVRTPHEGVARRWVPARLADRSTVAWLYAQLSVYSGYPGGGDAIRPPSRSRPTGHLRLCTASQCWPRGSWPSAAKVRNHSIASATAFPAIDCPGRAWPPARPGSIGIQESDSP